MIVCLLNTPMGVIGTGDVLRRTTLVMMMMMMRKVADTTGNCIVSMRVFEKTQCEKRKRTSIWSASHTPAYFYPTLRLLKSKNIQ